MGWYRFSFAMFALGSKSLTRCSGRRLTTRYLDLLPERSLKSSLPQKIARGKINDDGIHLDFLRLHGAHVRYLGIDRGGASPTEPSAKNSRRGRVQIYLQRMMGGLFSAAGFVSSSAKSLVTNRKQFGQWKKCLDALDAYLKNSGIEREISKVTNGRLLDNIIIFRRIQSAALRGRDTRDFTYIRRALFQSSFGIPSYEEARRYMKFATSAYGESMIRAAEMHVKGEFDTKTSPLLKKKIARHIGLPEEDIIVMDLDDAGCDLNHLRHFVAVDRVNSNVVLSLRGTFNLAELVVDVAAFSRPFMGGEAHSEMATMAERVWEVSGPTVRRLLEEGGKDYGLIITGHSLGAGTACLLNILLHQDRKRQVHGRRVRCFAYASPPVFSPLSVAPREAFESTTNYIHNCDVVPFLSVSSVRNFLSCLAAIDLRTKEMTWLDRQRLVTGYVAPDDHLCRDVLKARLGRLPPKSGAPLLAVPAAANVWIRENNDSNGKYDAKVCDPVRLAKLGIVVDPDMLIDHFPTAYEHALDGLGGADS